MLHKGDVLKGRYLVLQKIGSGGHGTVFRARDRAKNRVVAIKVLRSDLADDADYVRRFHREARIAALLDSRHIVRVLETDHVRLRNEYVDFQVMEYVDGPTLQHVLSRRGRFSTAEALHIAIQIARALEEAHDKGVLHHDIKPKNIFIGEDETAKVGDFGIARAVDFPTARDDAVVGTPNYMSPERCRGEQEQVDVRSDIYSLGVVVYQMLAGRPPFEGDSPSSICYRHIHDTPAPLRDIVPALPERVQEFVDRCLQKAPQDRFQTPRELRRALEGLMEAERADRMAAEMPPPVTRAPRRKPMEPVGRDGFPPRTPTRPAATSRAWWRRLPPVSRITMGGGFFAVLVLALGLAAFVLSRDGPSHTAAPTPTPTPTPTVEPSAESVVAYVDADGNLRVASEDGEDLKQLTNDGGVVHPSWSPDGRRIAYVHVTREGSSGVPNTELVVVNWDGSDSRTVHEAGRQAVLRNPRWSPDGSAIYYLEDRGEQDTHLNRLILGSDKVEGDLVDPVVLFGESAYLESFDVRPGDGTIVYQGCRAERPQGCGLGLQSAPGTASRTAVLVPIQDGYSYRFPAWSLDGTEIGVYAYTGDAPTIMVVPADGRTLRHEANVEGKPEAVENRFWPTLTPLAGGGFAYESADQIRISGRATSATPIVGRHPAAFHGSRYRGATPGTPWPMVENLDCGGWWKGEYFANVSLEGDLTIVRCDEDVNFDWEDGSPWVLINADQFSARWTRRVSFESGTYTFRAFSDDGVKLSLDGDQVIDEWRPQHKEHKKDIPVDQGEHVIEMQFYDETGEAVAQLSWERVQPTPTPTPSRTPTRTATPTAAATSPTPPPVTLTPTPSGLLPDLTVTRLTWEPDRPVEGDKITKWCVIVENRGGEFTGYPAPTLNISVDGDRKVGPQQIQLRAGESRELCFPSANWNGPWPFGVGRYQVVAEIDADDNVRESNEGNNALSRDLIVEPQP